MKNVNAFTRKPGGCELPDELSQHARATGTLLGSSPRPGANTSSNVACAHTLLHPPGARFVPSQWIGHAV